MTLRNADELTNSLVDGINVAMNALRIRPADPAEVATAGAGTITAAQLFTGCILRDCAGSSRTDTLAAAADIIAQFAMTPGDRAQCSYVNTSDAAETITIAGGTGTTIRGTITIAQNNATTLEIICVTSSAVCVHEA